MVATMALSVSMTAYAKTGPDDYYDSFENSGRLRVGTDIAPGEYVLFNKGDTKNATVSVRNSGDTVLSDSFWYNYIVDLEDGEDIYLANCYLVELDEAMVYSTEEGFYKVGEHIMPGTYEIEWIRGSERAQATIMTELLYQNDEGFADASSWKKNANIDRKATYEVELFEGNYIKLAGCRLIYAND